jgi:hypothetical protein
MNRMSLNEVIGVYVFVGVIALSLIACSDILFGDPRAARRKRLNRTNESPSYDEAGFRRLYRTILRKIKTDGD